MLMSVWHAVCHSYVDMRLLQLSIIDRILTTHAASRTYRLFIATDEIEFITYMNATRHGDKVRQASDRGYMSHMCHVHVYGT